MSFKPPQSAINNAKRGLKLRQEWGRGGLSPAEAKAQGIDSGVTRARKIASGTVSEHDVRRMSAFNRHRKNYRPEKKMPDGGPTAGTIAWLLWGGTSGVNWAKKKSAAMNAEDEKEKCPSCLEVTFLDGDVCDDCTYCEYCEEYHPDEVTQICYENAYHKHYDGPAEDPEYTTMMDAETIEDDADFRSRVLGGGDLPEELAKQVCSFCECDEDDELLVEVMLDGYSELICESCMDAETFEAEDPDDPELLGYMVSVPVLHHYTVGPVEAYNPEDAQDEVVDNWRYWRSTIDNNGDWGGAIWRYRGIDISEPEAYLPTEYEASGLTMPAGFQEIDDYYSDDGAHIITAEIPFLAPKGYYIADMEFHDGHIEVIFVSEDNKTFDADWRDLPRDSKGRWMSKEQPSSSPKVSTYSRSMITLRDLTEQLQESLGLTDFNSAYFTVQQMLDAFPGGDSDEARRALRNTIEDTRMILEYDETIDYPTHIQIMADIYRESGDVPPEQYEEAVFNRLAFEDEFAAERRVKPNLPVPSPDYTYSETFGKNIVLLSEDEEEGPTVEDFFRDVEKVFNKYGEFNWESEQHDDGLAISCFLVPWNGAYNFFQYDEDFSQYRDE